jgi:hypothetical protein
VERNIPAFENVANLHLLPAEGFHIIALPMKIRGGSGGPLRIVAFMATWFSFILILARFFDINPLKINMMSIVVARGKGWIEILRTPLVLYVNIPYIW